MPLPRLTEIGDSAVLTVATCVPIEVDDGPAVRFTFDGHPDDILTLPRLGVDGALLQMNLVVPGGGRGDEPVIDYAGLAGETFKFSRGAPKRGTRPTWRIDRIVPVAAPSAPPAAEPPASKASAPLSVSEPAREPAGAVDGEQGKRDVIHAAYLRELAWVLDGPYKEAKKKKHDLDVNAAVATLLIQMDRRRCL